MKRRGHATQRQGRSLISPHYFNHFTCQEKPGFAFGLIFFSLLFWRYVNASCPDMCTCKWKGGKQTVECINKQLTTIPLETDAGTQVLDMTGNSLVILSHEKFKVIQLTNLQRIYMSRCRLVQIDDAAFRDLTNLIEIDLSHNELSLIPTTSFEHTTGLIRLQMSYNPVSKIKNRSFSSLKSLTTLELTGCLIETIEPRGFYGLDKLEWLKLDANQLTTLPRDIFIPKSLHGIDLHNNPWKCDCHLRSLRTWMVKYNVPSSIEPRCALPTRLETRIIKELKLHDFACPPEIRPTSLFLDVLEGKNVSFDCHVTAEPLADIYWTFNGVSLENSSFLFNGSMYYDVYEETGYVSERISHLRIEMVSESHSGIFQCVATNLAGQVVSNFTLRVSVPIEQPLPREVIVDHIYYIASALIALAVLVVVLFCVLIWRCYASSVQQKNKQHIIVSSNAKSKEIPTSSNNMPKHIQMGTPVPKMNGTIIHENYVSVIEAPYKGNISASRSNPDLISGNPTEKVKKKVSIMGVEEVDSNGMITTRKLDDIIEEYEDGQDALYDHLHEQCIGTVNFSHTLRHPRHSERINPYPLTQVPPDDYQKHVSMFDPSLEYCNPETNMHRNRQCASVEVPFYATMRRKKSIEDALMHDQKYPEEYNMEQNTSNSCLAESHYPQPYGLGEREYCMMPNKISGEKPICECCSEIHSNCLTVKSNGRIGGDGCSFDTLITPCKGVQCCFAHNIQQFENNYLDDSRPPPPEGWRDDDIELSKCTDWCDNPQSPGTRVLYSPDTICPNSQKFFSQKTVPDATDV